MPPSRRANLEASVARLRGELETIILWKNIGRWFIAFGAIAIYAGFLGLGLPFIIGGFLLRTVFAQRYDQLELDLIRMEATWEAAYGASEFRHHIGLGGSGSMDLPGDLHGRT